MNTSYNIGGVSGSGQPDAGTSPSGQTTNADIKMFLQEIETLLQELQARDDAPDRGEPAPENNAAARYGGPDETRTGIDPKIRMAASGMTQTPDGASSPSSNTDMTQSPIASNNRTSTSPSSLPVTSAGNGANEIQIINTTSKPMTLGQFQNGQSTTIPSASITLQPGQTGTVRYENGEARFIEKSDSSGTFQSNASRLEYEADANSKQKYPDISYIDGRNASISLTDNSGLHKGDDRSIAADAPASAVTTDAAGNKTIAGYYDGSTAVMQTGADYMQSQLGTNDAYLHPNDDQLSAGNNPMSSMQSNIFYASFGDA